MNKKDPRGYEPYFTKWMSELTERGLHDKADIALELASQTKRIVELEKHIVEGYHDAWLERNYNMTSTILNMVIEKFKDREKVGLEKYKVTLDRKDLTVAEWLTHAQEEAMDLVLYLEKILQYKNEVTNLTLYLEELLRSRKNNGNNVPVGKNEVDGMGDVLYPHRPNART